MTCTVYRYLEGWNSGARPDKAWLPPGMRSAPSLPLSSPLSVRLSAAASTCSSAPWQGHLSTGMNHAPWQQVLERERKTVRLISHLKEECNGLAWSYAQSPGAHGRGIKWENVWCLCLLGLRGAVVLGVGPTLLSLSLPPSPVKPVSVKENRRERLGQEYAKDSASSHTSSSFMNHQRARPYTSTGLLFSLNEQLVPWRPITPPHSKLPLWAPPKAPVLFQGRRRGGRERAREGEESSEKVRWC